MKTRTRYIPLAVVCTVLVLAGALSVHAQIGTLQRYEFRSEDHEPFEALRFYRATELGALDRLLVLIPEGRTVVLTTLLRPLEGTYTWRIFDEETTWWAEVELRNTPEKNLETFFAANGQPWMESTPLTLRTSDGRRWTGSVDPAHEGERTSWVVRGFDNPEIANLLEEEMPRAFKVTVSFLHSAIAHEVDLRTIEAGVQRPTDWSYLLQALCSAVGGCIDVDHWELVPGKTSKGLFVNEPRDLAFIGNFQSVENADPLADFDLLVTPEAGSSED